jgi:hypothetical protein
MCTEHLQITDIEAVVSAGSFHATPRREKIFSHSSRPNPPVGDMYAVLRSTFASRFSHEALIDAVDVIRAYRLTGVHDIEGNVRAEVITAVRAVVGAGCRNPDAETMVALLYPKGRPH